MFVHTLQQAWYGGDGPAPVRSWLFEGMADYLSFDPGDVHALPGRLRQFVADTVDARTRWTNVRTLEELCTVDEPLQLGEFFAARTPGLQPGPESDPWIAFYRQGALLYQFLHESDDGRYQKNLLAFEKRAFDGEHDAKDFAASLAPRKLPDVERSFLDWVREQHRAAFPDVALDRDTLRAATARGADGKPLGLPAPAPATPSKAPPEPAREKPAAAVEPAKPAPTSSAATAPAPTPLVPLRYDDATPEESYAAALADMAAGHARAASEALTALMPQLSGTELGPVLQRDLERIAAWTAARDAFLTRLAGSDETLEIAVERVSTTKWRVRSLEEGVVVLDDKKGGVKRVPVEDLDPLALARQMEDGADSWTRYYLYVLREDERWKKLLREDGGPASALLADARDVYAARVRLGRAVVALRDLAAQPAPTASADVDRQVDAVRLLLKDLGDTSLVTRKRDVLRNHARALLERRFGLQPPLKRLAGKVETLGKERVRITYDFSDARQLADFDPAPYPVLASKGFNGGGEESRFWVEDGKLVAVEKASLRTVYDLGAPLTVRYDLEFVDAKVPDPKFCVALGICDDGHEHFLWALNLNGLQLLDKSASDHSEEPERALYLDTRYALELEHDGERVTLRCEGLEQSTLGVGNRRSGAVFLRAVSQIPVRIESLTIEGQLLPESFQRMQRLWAEAQMAGW
jgi:hypothetical protein